MLCKLHSNKQQKLTNTPDIDIQGHHRRSWFVCVHIGDLRKIFDMNEYNQKLPSFSKYLSFTPILLSFNADEVVLPVSGPGDLDRSLVLI